MSAPRFWFGLRIVFQVHGAWSREAGNAGSVGLPILRSGHRESTQFSARSHALFVGIARAMPCAWEKLDLRSVF